MTKMQKPSGGCQNCGGAVRTYKSGWGWVCAKCVRLLKAEPAIRRSQRPDPGDEQ